MANLNPALIEAITNNTAFRHFLGTIDPTDIDQLTLLETYLQWLLIQRQAGKKQWNGTRTSKNV